MVQALNDLPDLDIEEARMVAFRMPDCDGCAFLSKNWG